MQGLSTSWLMATVVGEHCRCKSEDKGNGYLFSLIKLHVVSEVCRVRVRQAVPIARRREASGMAYEECES